MSLARAAAGPSSSMLRRLATVPAQDGQGRRVAAAITSSTTMASIRPQWQAQLPCHVRSSNCYDHHRLFHTSAPRPARRRKRFNSVPAAKLGLIDEDAITKFTKDHFPEYTAEEKEVLAEKYTEEQLVALMAGEASVDPRDLTVQGRLRADAGVLGFPYVDDFAKVQPVVDKRPLGPTAAARDAAVANTAIDAKPMTDEEFEDDFMAWMESFVPKDVNMEGLSDEQLEELAKKHGPQDEDFLKYWFDRPALMQRSRTTAGEAKRALTTAELGTTSQAPSLGSEIPGVTKLFQRLEDPADEGLDEDGQYQGMKRQTGLQVKEMYRIVTREIVVRMVHNQTRLGKIRRFSVVAIAGNCDGRLGIGMGKAVEAQDAVAQAKRMAILNMRPIRRYENRTIYGKVEGKVGGTIVRLESRPPGFGLRVSHRLFEMARAAGISDLAGTIPRSRNPMNTVKAAYAALTNQPDPEQMAIGRGKKLVDARKVYYGGAVY